MPYLGNTPADRFTTTTVDTFNGDNSTTEFTLSRSAVTNDLEVIVENVQQEPTTAYSVSGTTLTFTAAPPTGTGNIYVIHRGAAISSVTPADNTITTAMLQDDAVSLAKLSATGTPSSSTYLRGDNSWAALSTTFEGLTDTTVSTSDPTISSNPSATGHLWVNKTSGEVYVCTDATTDANVWTNVGDGSGIIEPGYAISYVVVGGGGGSGQDRGGGGGAGGYRNSYASETSGRNSSTEAPLTVPAGTVLTITVGGGGSPSAASNTAVAGDGGESKIIGTGINIVALGGGGGGSQAAEGADGGAGGGNGSGKDVAAGGAGASGQGFDGGQGYATESGSYLRQGGGGGGASEDGVTGTSSVRADGGDGLTTNIKGTGSPLTLAGGGAGGTQSGTAIGGAGGGGNTNVDGGTNTGGGAGGGSDSSAGKTGGSGIVIIRMATSNYSGTYSGAGVTVGTDGSDTYLVFTQSGTYTA